MFNKRTPRFLLTLRWPFSSFKGARPEAATSILSSTVSRIFPSNALYWCSRTASMRTQVAGAFLGLLFWVSTTVRLRPRKRSRRSESTRLSYACFDKSKKRRLDDGFYVMRPVASQFFKYKFGSCHRRAAVLSFLRLTLKKLLKLCKQQHYCSKPRNRSSVGAAFYIFDATRR